MQQQHLEKNGKSSDSGSNKNQNITKLHLKTHSNTTQDLQNQNQNVSNTNIQDNDTKLHISNLNNTNNINPTNTMNYNNNPQNSIDSDSMKIPSSQDDNANTSINNSIQNNSNMAQHDLKEQDDLDLEQPIDHNEEMKPLKRKKEGEGILADMRFCTSGTLAMDPDEFEKLIQDNGGTLSKSLSKTVTHFVCGASPMTAKVSKARERGVEIIDEEWVRQKCGISEPQREAEIGSLPTIRCFQGMCFSIHGNVSMNRNEFEILLQSNGGSVLKSVTKSVTHLICQDKSCSKATKARERGVQVVDEGWIHGVLTGSTSVPRTTASAATLPVRSSAVITQKTKKQKPVTGRCTLFMLSESPHDPIDDCFNSIDDPSSHQLGQHVDFHRDLEDTSDSIIQTAVNFATDNRDTLVGEAHYSGDGDASFEAFLTTVPSGFPLPQEADTKTWIQAVFIDSLDISGKIQTLSKLEVRQLSNSDEVGVFFDKPRMIEHAFNIPHSINVVCNAFANQFEKVWMVELRQDEDGYHPKWLCGVWQSETKEDLFVVSGLFCSWYG